MHWATQPYRHALPGSSLHFAPRYMARAHPSCNAQPASLQQLSQQRAQSRLSL